LWRLKYRFAGAERLLAIGEYPDVALATARKRAGEARDLVRQGVDPVQHGREQRAQRQNAALQTFAVVDDEWIGRRAKKWTEGHAEQTRQSLRDYVLPKIGKRPISALTAIGVKRVLDPLEAAGKAETLRRVRQRVNSVFSYAVRTGLRADNPVREMRGAYDAPVREHFASITPKELPAFLDRLDAYQGHPTKKALKKTGYGGRLTGHGLRAAVATGLEEMGCSTEFIKSQLSHAKANLTDAAYLRGLHVEKRAAMMQAWADHLEGSLAATNVVPLKASR
jgi:integrase